MMDHTPQSAPTPPSNSSPLDDPALGTLLRQTFQEETARVALLPDALPRLNARLDAANPPRRWPGALRLAGAVAVAALLLALFTPVGRLAAAAAHNAAQTIVTTVRQVTSGDGNGDSTPPSSGTAIAPRATNASGSSAAPTNGAGSPATGGTANPTGATTGSPVTGTVNPVIGTPAGTATRAVATPIGTAIQPSGAAAPVGTRTGTASPTAATATPTSSTIVATMTVATAPTAPLPPTPRSETPDAHPSVTVSPSAP